MKTRKRTERGPSGEEMALAGVGMTEDPVGASMMIEAHAVAGMKTAQCAEGWTTIVVRVEALMMTAARGGVETMSVPCAVASMMTAAPGVVLKKTEVLEEAWTTQGVPGAVRMMTGAPEEEEMMTEVEGEEWTTGRVAVMMTTPNPGSRWADLVSLQPF